MKLDEIELEVDFFDFDENLYQTLDAKPLNKPYLISYSKSAASLIDLDEEECESIEFVKFMNGEKILKGSRPYSMVYSGHQFGYYVPQLGDGRAINLGSKNGWHLQTKGSGLTKYSRQGDGRAVLRSSIREFIISELMHALGIPTTRALALIGSEHKVHRSFMEVEKGAIVMRMSPSWIRIGTFEFFARTDKAEANLKQLTDYVIKQSYPHLESEKNRYEKMFYEIVDKTANLIALWQVYGFMHGVMNTDNMSIAGLTIDYGPYAFMDYFKMDQICNYTDSEGRYSYGNQPFIAKWNLSVLANALSKIVNKDLMMQYLETFLPQFEKSYLELMNKRLGLEFSKADDLNVELIKELLASLEASKIDYNCFFHTLTKLEDLSDISPILDICIYRKPIEKWFEEYRKIVKKDGYSKELMKTINPKYVIKNYMLQEAIVKAQKGDFSLVNDLLNIAQNPFDEHITFEKYSKPTPLNEANLQLSCSS